MSTDDDPLRGRDLIIEEKERIIEEERIKGKRLSFPISWGIIAGEGRQVICSHVWSLKTPRWWGIALIDSDS